MGSLKYLEIGKKCCEFFRIRISYTCRQLEYDPMIVVRVVRTEPSGKDLEQTLIRMPVRVSIWSNLGQPFLQDPMRGFWFWIGLADRAGDARGLFRLIRVAQSSV